MTGGSSKGAKHDDGRKRMHATHVVGRSMAVVVSSIVIHNCPFNLTPAFGGTRCA
jgi:hypothetical protein